MGAPELEGQARVIAVVRSLVDEWRGFALGNASAAYSAQAPRYEATRDGEQAVSETTLRLLHHWFRHEPHVLPDGKGGRCSFKPRRIAKGDAEIRVAAEFLEVVG